MDALDDAAYIAILRTREAELKGFRYVDADTSQSLLPVMEFTRSRRSKKNPTGAVARCVDDVMSIVGDGLFIADVTTLTAFGSSETQDLLNPDQAFANWQAFAGALGPQCVPIVHLTDPFDAASVQAQATSLVKNCGVVAVRIPPDYADVAALEGALVNVLGSMNRVILICDAGFVDRKSYTQQALASYRTLFYFQQRPRLSVVACSCFPASVVLPNYGKDAYGKFPLLEVAMSEWIKQQAGTRHVLHGDYGLVYPEDVTSTATRWVPRVDVPLDTDVFYHRYRREAGGYVTAAQHALADGDYQMIPCWAHDNIVDASKGNPQGKSPAHWIAVRVNYHITRQVARLT